MVTSGVCKIMIGQGDDGVDVPREEGKSLDKTLSCKNEDIDENLHFENVRDALRAYERFVVWSIFCSVLVVAYTLDRPDAMVSIGYGQVRIGLANVAALSSFCFFYVAASYPLSRAVENTLLVKTRAKRNALVSLPSIATDHRSSFRVVMLILAPLLILTAVTMEVWRSTGPIGEWLGAFILTIAMLVVGPYRVWEQLKELERALQPGSAAEPASPTRNQLHQARRDNKV
jgi:hypothetical protein